MTFIITSAKNPEIQKVRKLISTTSFRKEHQLCVLEHRAAIFEMIKTRPSLIQTIYCVEGDEIPYKCTRVSSHVMLAMSSLKTPPGVLAVIKIPRYSWKEYEQNADLILVLEGIQTSGNVGAILRNAAAFGVGAVYCVGTSDPYHPESIRASTGTLFKVPIFSCELSELISLKKNRTFWGLQAGASQSLSDTSFEGKNAFVLGAEGRGLSIGIKEILNLNLLQIEMSEEVESLNVAVSSGILLYNLNTLRTQ